MIPTLSSIPEQGGQAFARPCLGGFDQVCRAMGWRVTFRVATDELTHALTRTCS
jgi:hypothetical protein